MAEAVYGARPFGSLEALYAAMVQAVDGAGPEAQLALVRAHPDLGARVRMSSASVGEQAGVGLDRLDPATFERFQDLNRRYKDRFGFPFIIAVRDHTPLSILAAFERRLLHTPEAELEAALAEVARIAGFRLHDLLGESP